MEPHTLLAAVIVTFDILNDYLAPITQGVLVQSPEPEAHDKVLDNYPDRIRIWKCWGFF